MDIDDHRQHQPLDTSSSSSTTANNTIAPLTNLSSRSQHSSLQSGSPDTLANSTTRQAGRSGSGSRSSTTLFYSGRHPNLPLRTPVVHVPTSSLPQTRENLTADVVSPSSSPQLSSVMSNHNPTHHHHHQHHHNHSSRPTTSTTSGTNPTNLNAASTTTAPNGTHSTSPQPPPNSTSTSNNHRTDGQDGSSKVHINPMKGSGLGGKSSSAGGAGGRTMERSRRLDTDELKKHEDVIMRNLVLDYLSSACFPTTARILSRGLGKKPSSSSSSSSGPSSGSSSDFDRLGSQANEVVGLEVLGKAGMVPDLPTSMSAMTDAGAQGEKEMNVNVNSTTTMSSSISDLARIIDPRLINAGDDDDADPGPTSGMERGGSPLMTTGSTVMPSLSGWTGLGSAMETMGGDGGMEEIMMTMVNGKKRGGVVVDDHVDGQVDVDMDRPLISGRMGRTMEDDSARGRNEWIKQIERRKEIRDLVASGNIVLAMDQLRRHFPGVIGNYGVQPLSEWKKEDEEGSSHGLGFSKRRSTEVDEEGVEVDEPDEEEDEDEEDDEDEDSVVDDDRNGSNEDELMGRPTTASSAQLGLNTPATGSRPVNLYLTLAIQSFIENIRQLEPSSDQDMDLSSMASSMHSDFGGQSEGNAPARNGKSLALEVTQVSSPEPSGRMTPRDGDNLLTSNGAGGNNKSSRTLACIAQAQRLYAEVTTYFEEEDAQPFINILEGATALLAYPDMGSSPLAFWLSPTRRTDLAKVVNDSIIAHQGGHRYHDPSALLTLIKQTSAVTDEMKARSIDLNPGWTVGKDGQALAALSHFINTKQRFDFNEYMSER